MAKARLLTWPEAGSEPGRPDGIWLWDGAPGPPFMLFLPSGAIGGTAAAHLASWRALPGGALLLADHRGTEFRFVSDGAIFHYDDQTLTRGGDWNISSLPPIQGAGRRNLVVLRSGDNSLHPLWLETMAGEPRNWDLCLSYYGDNPSLWRDQPEYFIAQKGSKYRGLAAMVKPRGLVWHYDYIWFPDDDLLIAGSAINRMFALARRHDLLLAQPSLARGCFVNHRITERQPDCRLRFTSFVEIMAPLFARDALAVAAPSFGLNDTGYGLDHLWPALLGWPQNRIAMLDEIEMVHTRPMGANYDITGASGEGWDLLERFGLGQLYATYGALPLKTHGWSRARGKQGQPMPPQLLS